jgi:hypothetical protein
MRKRRVYIYLTPTQTIYKSSEPEGSTSSVVKDQIKRHMAALSAQTPGTAHQQSDMASESRLRFARSPGERVAEREASGIALGAASECIRFAGDPQGWLAG